MKKLLAIIATICLVTISHSVYAQHIQEWTSDFYVRYGNYGDETVRICVLVDMNGNDYQNATYVLSTRFGGELLPCSIQLHGQSKLMQFHSDLKQIRNKYGEWLTIARQNGVKDLVKEIPTYTKQIELTLYDGKMNELKTLNTQLKGIFRAEFSSLSIFPNNDSIRIGFNTTNGESVPIFHVRTIADLDKILNALDIARIKPKINAKQQKNNLFN